MRAKYYFSHILTLIIYFADVFGQKVPCKNEVLFGDYFGEKQRSQWVNRDFTQEIAAFKKLDRFSFSFWTHKNAVFDFQVKVSRIGKENLIQFQYVGTASPSQLLIKSDYYKPNTLPITKTLDKKWTYLFITLDIVETKQSKNICLFLVDGVKDGKDEKEETYLKRDVICLPLNISEFTFEFEKIEIVNNLITLEQQKQILTRNLYFHRGYGLLDLKDEQESILKQMIRDDAKLISSYLFNQDILEYYLNDNNDFYQNNINFSKLKSTEIPTIFHNSLRFFKTNYVQFSGFRMSQISKEFTISFSIFTNVTDSNPVQILSLTDRSASTSFFKILIKNRGFDDDIIFEIKNNSQQMSCKIKHLDWNFILITGFSYGRLNDGQPQKYFIQVFLNEEQCKETITDTNLNLSNDMFYLIFGNPHSTYSDYFQIKALKIYSGSFSPIKSECSSLCLIQQSREHTFGEKIKFIQQQQSQTVSNQKPLLIQTESITSIVNSELQLLKNVNVNELYSAACLRCDKQKYMVGQYCVSGAAQCMDGIDTWASQCFPLTLCTDPLHDSTDCTKQCKPGYQIDNSAKCSISCHYSCSKCQLEKPKECIDLKGSLCPPTRKHNPVTKECECQSKSIDQIFFYDDGKSNECLQIINKNYSNNPVAPGNTSPNNSGTPTSNNGSSTDPNSSTPPIIITEPKSTLLYVFDIIYVIDNRRTKAIMSKQSLKIPQPSSSPELISSYDTTPTASANVDYGIQLYSQNFIKIQKITQNSSMKFWMYIEGQIDRLNKFISYMKDNEQIINIILNQIDNYQYGITLCIFSNCQVISPTHLKIKSSQWNMFGISFDKLDDQYMVQITIFVNSQSKLVLFEKIKDIPIMDTIQIGDYINIYSTAKQFIALRYISFYSLPFNYLDKYTYAQNKDSSCLVYSGDICIYCQKGFRFSSFVSEQCESENTKIDQSKEQQFYYQSIQMVHKCALNTIICSTCKLKPSICDKCSDKERNQEKNCECKETYYNTVNDECKKCHPKCRTCFSYDVCIECNDNRINPPQCSCIKEYLEPLDQESIEKGLCSPCDKTCSYCDTNQQKCICPDSTQYFRISENRRCPCKDKYYDETDSNQPCKKCFPNCKTCLNGSEDSCYTCYIDHFSKSNVIDKDQTKPDYCQCKNPEEFYLDFNGICKPYATVKFSLISDGRFRIPRIRIELSEELEKAETSEWLKLIEIRIYTEDKKGIEKTIIQFIEINQKIQILISILFNLLNIISFPRIITYLICLFLFFLFFKIQKAHKRNLSEDDDQNVRNLQLTAMNDKFDKNVGYININVLKSCHSYQLHVKITSNRAIRSKDGVPLKKLSYKELIIYNVSPFILKIDDDDLDYYLKQEQIVQDIQSNGMISFLRHISFPLFFFNCLQPISSLLMINTPLPIKPHILITQFSSFVFPQTPIWMNYNFSNFNTNDYILPSYTIYGNPVIVEDQDSYEVFQQMGISSSFMVNIAETFVLLTINGLIIAGLKYLNESQIQSFQDKKHYYYGISFFTNLIEVRLIYILLSIYLQLTNIKFSNPLNGISAIFACIFFILYLLFLYLIGKILNSPNEQNDFQYRRTQHLIDFLEITKHKLTLNYRYIQIFKKTLYFLVLILMFQKTKPAIILLIIIGAFCTLFDIILRPFKINWINNMKIISSISWLGVLISVLVSHNVAVEMQSQEYIISDSTLQSYNKNGEALFYLIWIYFSANSIILLLKLLSIIRDLYEYIINREKNELKIVINQKQGVNDQEGIPHALLYESLDNTKDLHGSIIKVVINPPRQVKSRNNIFNQDKNYQNFKIQQKQKVKFEEI